LNCIIFGSCLPLTFAPIAAALSGCFGVNMPASAADRLWPIPAIQNQTADDRNLPLN
jgi:hypothetical protein